MSSLLARGGLKKVEFEAVIIRADGTREELGVVSYWHRNPLRRWAYRLRHRGVGRVIFS